MTKSKVKKKNNAAKSAENESAHNEVSHARKMHVIFAPMQEDHKKKYTIFMIKKFI